MKRPTKALYPVFSRLPDKRPIERVIPLERGIVIRLVRIPAGVYVMGDTQGQVNEAPRSEVVIEKSFWMSVCETTNEQYRCYDPQHRSGVYTKRFLSRDGPGISLEGSEQPVVRVSWGQTRAFCGWLSEKTGMSFDLPTEDQWEYTCRAGTEHALNYGSVDADFSRHANMADASLRVAPVATGGLDSNINLHRGNGVFESALFGSIVPCVARFDDGQIVTAKVGSFSPNVWGLFDMHGNACEWTRSTYRAYPFDSDDGRNDLDNDGEKVVRGGSWVDRPKRCRSAFRLSYPAWQRVFNVGFRVVCKEGDYQARN